VAPPTKQNSRGRYAQEPDPYGLFTFVLATLIPAGAQAADPAFCRDYAQGAIRQVRGTMAHPRCMPFQGARWSADEQVHYNWCLGASYAAAGSERDARTGYLRGCAM
jgi:hypothetical protein